MSMRPGRSKGPWVGTSGGGGVLPGNAGAGIDISALGVISGRDQRFYNADHFMLQPSQLGTHVVRHSDFLFGTIPYPTIQFKRTVAGSDGFLGYGFGLVTAPGLNPATIDFVYKAENWYLELTSYFTTDGDGSGAGDDIAIAHDLVYLTDDSPLDCGAFATPDYGGSKSVDTYTAGNLIKTETGWGAINLLGGDRLLAVRIRPFSGNADVDNVYYIGSRFHWTNTEYIP